MIQRMKKALQAMQARRAAQRQYKLMQGLSKALVSVVVKTPPKKNK